MDTLLTFKPGKKNGIRMSTALYVDIEREIVDILESKEELTLQVFFDLLHSRFSHMLGENTGWYIYHVKADMEARGLISCQHLKKFGRKTTLIKIVTRNSNKSKGRTRGSGLPSFEN